MLSQQYATHFGRLIEAIWAPPLLLLGMIGLALRGNASVFTRPQFRTLRLLLCCELLVAALVLWGGEMWYLVYLIPIAAIGISLLLRALVFRWPSDWGGIGVILAAVCLWLGGFVWVNVQHARSVQRSVADYNGFSAEVGRRIPPGSRVLLAITPDPYFVLRNRPDLVLREYVPDSLPVAHDTYWHYLSKTDYIVIGKPNLFGFSVEEFVEANGMLLGTVGTPDAGYFARIYKVNRPRSTS